MTLKVTFGAFFDLTQKVTPKVTLHPKSDSTVTFSSQKVTIRVAFESDGRGPESHFWGHF